MFFHASIRNLLFGIQCNTVSKTLHHGLQLFMLLILSTSQIPAAIAVDAPPATLASSITELEFFDGAQGVMQRRDIVLTHTGLGEGAPITISSVYLDEPGALMFSSDFVGPVEIPSGESYVIEVRYLPTSQGEHVGALFISHTGDSNLEVFTLVGEAGNPTLNVQRAAPNGSISFGKGILAGAGSIQPTSLQFGPDGRLYAADLLGIIKAYTIKRNGSGQYQVTDTETITAVRDIPNHDDNGKPNAKIKKRLVTGLTVTGTANTPIIYVASSDPRIGGGPGNTDTSLDTNSGIISRLTRQGSGWKKLDLVRGLPRSEENHHGNGLVYDANRNVLLIAMGGNTNQGAPSKNFALLPEFALSAAILEVNLGQIGNSTYDLPTLDDQDRPGIKDSNDPFGGNNGKNQARLVKGSPVQVYAPGFRNAYDMVLTADSRLYSIDNGPNAGWGAPPVGEGSQGKCTNAVQEPGVTYNDSLHFISKPGYYGGHPNPTRANKANTINNKNPKSAVDQANPIECHHRPFGKGSDALTSFTSSTNGMTEYTASNFGGDMKGDLLTAAYNNKIFRLQLNASGDTLVKKTALVTNVGKKPLDVTAQGDDSVFPGTIWAADFVGKQIVVFEPADYNGKVSAVCTGAAAKADDDKDGFSNADEKANGTDPCSAADSPSDVDNDGVSDLTDDDDDNDGIKDSKDVFPLDPDNGRGTSLPVSYTWENNADNAGYLFNLGFSGLMSNGKDDYLSLFDESQITAGGAAGVFTIDNVPATDSFRGQNDQAYAFQFGLDVTPNSQPFTVHTRVLAPFSGKSTPRKHQSMGFFIGTGDQDNYIKLVVNTLGSSKGGLQWAREDKAKSSTIAQVGAAVRGADAVDLFFTVDPRQGTVKAAYQLAINGKRQPVMILPGSTPLPKSWLTAKSGLAVGVIATSIQADPFTATWDFIVVEPGTDVTADQNNSNDGDTDDTSDNADDGDSNSDGNANDSNSDGGSKPADDDAGTATVIAFEAEDYKKATVTQTHRWQRGKRGADSGGASMTTTPDSGKRASGSKGSPRMDYAVKFNKAGTYHVWVRGWGDTNARGEGKSDSVHVGINGTLAKAASIQAFPDGWNWSRKTRGSATATIDVPSAGTHDINIWMREDGLSVDKLVLTQDASYRPTGAGPAIGSTGGSNGTGNNNNGGDDGSNDSNDSNDSNGAGNSDDASGNTDNEPSQGANGDLLIALENYQGTTGSGVHNWKRVSRSGAEGGQAIEAGPDHRQLFRNPAQAPRVSYSVSIDKAGTYYIWLRGAGDTNAKGEGKNDSVYVGINNNAADAVTVEHFPAGWNWSNQARGNRVASITFKKAGKHTLNLWMREDGIVLDTLVLTRQRGATAPTGNTGNTGSDSGTGNDDGGAANTDDTDSTTGQSGTAAANANWRLVKTKDRSTPTARHEAGAVTVNGQLLLMGGRNDRPVSIFNAALNTWREGAKAPLELNHFQPVVVGKQVYVAAAMTGKFPRENNVPHVYTYTPSTDSWARGDAIPKARQRGSAGAVQYKGKIYLVGGNTRGHDGGAVAWFDEYNPATGQWRVLPDAPTVRDHANAVLIDGKLIVAGGRRTDHPKTFENLVSDVDIYDFRTGRWSAGAPLPTPRAGTMAVAAGQEMIVIGGEVANIGKALGVVEAYNVRSNSWRRLKSLNVGRHSGGAAVLNKAIHVVSGNERRGGGQESTAHEVLTLK